ncbi:nickel transporter [Intrasporangium chromatireducens Q5-1]|uniref:Nickel/cobalt efflux system n=1 Tax=Intrasporangium chromatireducens Q5-1 TaxID=584657 RepID=W9GV22_9MICO|nr:HoxN/HupN/NixA family nickel/cobalt transporter [Intrasporangium chromatireducens]EWT07724.1 nickel transporter [Intrasporangium chromatireducens Q5-1]
MNTTQPGRAGLDSRPGSAFGAENRRSLVWMGLFIACLHLLGWGLLVWVIVPQQYRIGGQLFGVGLGLTAYTLGMRHAFDADHIAAIDNTTRKLIGDGRRPTSVGFWFSLGHSSVVFIMVMLLAFGIRAMTGAIRDENSTLQSVTGVWGTLISGLFLILIGAINLGALAGILKVYKRMRAGHYDEAELERQLDSRGFLNRLLGRVTRTVRKPWHMYPIGFLFGLGFDTVTEVGLLVVAGGAAATNLPWYAVLTLPVLFAAGMSLLDTIDGAFMNLAYGWAFTRPVRKIFYNLTVTALSVAVALVVGVIELTSILTDKLGLATGPIAWVGRIDLGEVGFWIVGLFLLTWLGALAVWRFRRIEERWGSALSE